MKHRSILVTGGTGFIGSRLIRALNQQGARVTSLARRASAQLPPTVKQIQLDLTHPGLIERMSADTFDYVFHTAAAVSYRYPQPSQYRRTNVSGTKQLYHVLAYLHRRRPLKKVIHVSSVGVYGPIERLPADESHPHRPSTLYEQTKDRAEHLALAAAASGLPVNVIQPTLVYGPGDTSSGMYRLISSVTRHLYLSIGFRPVYMHPLYLDNLIQALILAATTGHTGQTWIIGDSQPLPLSQLARLISRLSGSYILPFSLPLPMARAAAAAAGPLARLGLQSPLKPETITFATSHRAYSIAKAKNMLHYQPQSTRSGITQTLSWLRAHDHI